MRNAISWFELPVTDLTRAITFYETVLGQPLGKVTAAGNRRFAMFSAEDGVTGAVVQGDGYVPSDRGALVFLHDGDELDPAVRRVEAGGGRVELARFDMGDWGVAAFITDSEGNRVALHAKA
jgi:predicted enzyme related to lactoylglutathione lyase